uniref:Uncharacterized protein n=1 Tax=Oryza brachyantha TaxID=4533 RepID=J3KV32_ORYBR
MAVDDSKKPKVTMAPMAWQGECGYTCSLWILEDRTTTVGASGGGGGEVLSQVRVWYGDKANFVGIVAHGYACSLWIFEDRLNEYVEECVAYN